MKRAMLLLATVAMVGGCDLAGFGKSIAVGAGSTIGSFIAEFALGYLPF